LGEAVDFPEVGEEGEVLAVVGEEEGVAMAGTK
jgi:hypothetical protein